MRNFEPEAIRQQIENLLIDRERIDRAIRALQSALESLEELPQQELEFSPENTKVSSGGKVTLQEAIMKSCAKIEDAVSRRRVLQVIEKDYPLLKPKSSSVSAALIKLSRGENPFLIQTMEGKGRTGSLYSANHDSLLIKLSAEEASALLDSKNTTGSGGWQSLFASLQQRYNKETGELDLSPQLRSKIYHYYHSYGSGGFQNRARKIFRRHFPSFFTE